MKLSSAAKFAIFVGIALGGLGGAGAIYNHFFPSGEADHEEVKIKVNTLEKDGDRRDYTLKIYGERIKIVEDRAEKGELADELGKRERGEMKKNIGDLTSKSNTHEDQIDTLEGEVSTLTDKPDAKNEELNKLKGDFETYREKTDRAQKENDRRNTAHDERIKRLERLLGVDASE